MKLRDLSTRRLKRLYLREIRRTWRLQPHRLDGFSRDIGLSGEYWDARTRAENARTLLKERGTDMP